MSAGPPSFFSKSPPSRRLERLSKRSIHSLYVLANGFFTITLLALVAKVSGTPFIFPSLGPTAFVLFATPQLPASTPRNTICGHAIGILCGFVSIRVTGLAQTPSAMVAGVDWDRILAASLSLGLTGGLMILLDRPHPPAGATTLIVSLGIVKGFFHLVVLEAAVAVLTLQAILINRVVGIDYPIWSRRKGSAPREGGTGPGTHA